MPSLRASYRVSSIRIAPFGYIREAVDGTHLMRLSEILQPLHEDMLAKWPKANHCFGRAATDPGGLEQLGPQKGPQSSRTTKRAKSVLVPGCPLIRLRDSSTKKKKKKKNPADIGETKEKAVIALLKSILQHDLLKRPFGALLPQHVWFYF